MKDNILRLNPFFALFKPLNALVVLLDISILALAIFGKDKRDILLAVIAVILIITTYYRWTKKIYIGRDSMEFVYYHRIGGFKRGIHVKALYHVRNIQNLRFEQNPVEKLFGAGHFSFTCRSSCDTNTVFDDVVPKTSFTFYGLSDFKNKRKEICNILGVDEVE